MAGHYGGACLNWVGNAVAGEFFDLLKFVFDVVEEALIWRVVVSEGEGWEEREEG